MLSYVAAWRTGEKGDGPRTRMRPLHEKRLAERLAARREERVGNLLDARIDRVHDRNPLQHVVPELDQLGADEVGRQHAGEEYNEDREDRAQTRDMHAKPVLGLERLRH